MLWLIEISVMDQLNLAEGGSEEQREKRLVDPQNGVARGRGKKILLRQLGLVAMVPVLFLSRTFMKCSRF